MLSESRKSLRTKENFGVNWQVKGNDFQGKGKVRNISTTGLLLETKHFPESLPSNVFQLESFINSGDRFLPSEGRLVWSEKKRNRVLCGLEFVDPPDSIVSNLRERIQHQITKATNARKARSIVGVLLSIIMVGIIAYILTIESSIFKNLTQSNDLLITSSDQQAQLTRTYSNLYEETKTILESTQKELDSTKELLAQTNQLLQEARTENQNLQQQLATLQGVSPEIIAQQAAGTSVRNELTAQIESLTEKNNQLVQEVNELKNKVRLFEGDIQSQEEGKEVLKLFYNRIKVVKGKMQVIRKEARHAQIAAQKEKDRILLLKGNQGYFFKNGKDFYQGNPDAGSGKDVEIGVTFVE